MKPYFDELTVVRHFNDSTLAETYRIGIIGGTVPGDPEHGTSNEPYTHVAVKWDAETLVIETSTHTGRWPETGDWAERLERWSLVSKGRLLIVTTTRGSAERVATVMQQYRRARDPRRHIKVHR